MVWIFNAIKSYEEGNLEIWKRTSSVSVVFPFRWKYPRKTVMYCRKRVLLDLGNGEILKIGKIYDKKPYGGWGWLLKKQDVISRIIDFNHEMKLDRKPVMFDWHDHRTGEPRWCVICGRKALCRDRLGNPCHRVCAEEVAA